MADETDPPKKQAKGLGWKVGNIDWLKHPPELVAGIAYAFAGILLLYGFSYFLILLYRAFVALTNAGPNYADEVNKLLLAIAGVIGAPFVVWRVLIANRANQVSKANADEQSRIANENLYATLLTKAVEQLGATREEKAYEEQTDENGKVSKVAVSRTVPNLEVRLGGIYALEKIAQDHLSLHWPIMEILCAYVRQNAGPARPPPPDYYSANALNRSAQQQERRRNDLCSLRIDIQSALNVIGRRPKTRQSFEAIQFSDPSSDNPDRWRLDLRACHLANADLTGLSFDRANFSHASLECSVASFAHFTQAVFFNTHLEGTIFHKARIEGARLQNACLDLADFSDAYLHAANLNQEQLKYARLNRVNLQGSFLENAILEGAALFMAQLQTATMDGASLVDARLEKAELQGALLDGAQFDRAELEGTNFSGAELDNASFNAASLFGAKFDGASLNDARFDDAWLCGCDLRNSTGISPTTLERAFGDERTQLPRSMDPPNNERWLTQNASDEDRINSYNKFRSKVQSARWLAKNGWAKTILSRPE